MTDKKLEEVIEISDLEVRKFTGDLKTGDKHKRDYINWMLNLYREFLPTGLRIYKDNQGVSYHFRKAEDDKLEYLMNNKLIMPDK